MTRTLMSVALRCELLETIPNMFVPVLLALAVDLESEAGCSSVCTFNVSFVHIIFKDFI